MRKKDVFFEKLATTGLAVTFDEVSLCTGHSTALPSEVSLESCFSRNIPLKTPIVSAAMDDVTEYPMAIALAKLGGLGVIHYNLSAKDQTDHVRRVKTHLSGLILQPATVLWNQTVENILNWRKANGFPFHSFLVIDQDQRLLGILSKEDFQFCKNSQKTARELLTRKPVVGTTAVTMDSAYETMQQQKQRVLPLVDDDNRVVGMYTYSDIKRIKFGVSAGYNLDEHGRLRVVAAVSVGKDAFERVEKLLPAGVDGILINSSHADSDSMINTLKDLKNSYPSLEVVIGNVSQGESAKRLVDAGADGILVGQGGGSICTTRVVTGIGCPQVTALYNCTKAIEGSGVPICSDGGIESSGHMSIALSMAHSVMLGRMIAGTDEAASKSINVKGIMMMSYRGMGSIAAMKQHQNSQERYSQGDVPEEEMVPQGIEAAVPYVGPLRKQIIQFTGGIRSGMAAVGAENIEHFHQIATFDRVSAVGLKESHPHGVIMTTPAPNYEGRG